MAEVVLFHLAGRILSSLGSLALEQIGMPWYAKEELRKLNNTVSTIRNVLLHAQEQQVHNPAVKEWLQRLKIMLYEADDLFDEIATEALRREVEINKSITRKVRYFFTTSNPVSFHFLVGHKIKDIRGRLDEIVLDMRGFKFVVRTLDKPIGIKRKEQTSSFLHTSEVIGREIDKKLLSRLLLSSIDKENVHIVPVVGMGGLGKTTIAQMIFNDKVVKYQFRIRLWVCVSDEFNVKRILTEILTFVGENVTNAGMEKLQNSFRQILSGEKFLLVLDDVWNDDPVEWKKLKDLLMTGAKGSRVLVTTRDKKVASLVCTTNPYELKGLSENDCLHILVKWAFEKGAETKHPRLIEIGKEIVKKCGGVPLAARTLGVLLYSKTSEHEWFSVRDNEMWTQVQNENDILPILRSSYDQMPSYLKECFGYCSIFEKDQIIHKENLIYGWMAHGLVQSSQRNEELEDVCEIYLEELLRRSFIEYEDFPNTYKMHDLVHDLAKYVAGCENLTIKGPNSTATISDKVRHLSFDPRLCSEFPRALFEESKLRTIIFPGSVPPEFISSVETAISSSRYLRELDFVINGPPKALAKAIGKSKHLRYLRCRGRKVFPKSFCKLLNLQFLDLMFSDFDKLPKDFGNLRNLRLLILSSRLSSLPEKGVRGLTSLQALVLSFNSELRSLDGIQHLTALRKLVIAGSPELASLPARLSHLTSLKHLEITACENLIFSDNDFKGLSSLTFLKLSSLSRLMTLPVGLLDTSATLKHLTFQGCKHLALTEEVLPNLQSLELLRIEYCERVVSLPKGTDRLSKLSHLRIHNCSILLSVGCKPRGVDWPKISHVAQVYVDGENIKSTT